MLAVFVGDDDSYDTLDVGVVDELAVIQKRKMKL